MISPDTKSGAADRPARGGKHSPRRVRRSPAPKIADQFGINAASKHAQRIRFKPRLAAFLTACPWHSTSEAVVMLAERGLAQFEQTIGLPMDDVDAARAFRPLGGEDFTAEARRRGE